jgi:hypothetical protein
MLFFWILASSGLAMETVCFSETLTTADECTRRQIPEEQHHHPHHRENLKSRNVVDKSSLN